MTNDFYMDAKKTFENVFLDSFGVKAIFKSSTELKEIAVLFDITPLEKLETDYISIECLYDEVYGIENNDIFEIDNTEYGVLSFARGEDGSTVKIFLQEIGK